MAISFDNVSSSDLDRANGIRNPNSIDAGDDFGIDDSGFDDYFGDSSGDDGGFAGLFDSIEDLTMDSSCNGGATENQMLSAIGQQNGGFAVNLNNQIGNAQAAQQKPDRLDAVIDYSIDSMASVGTLLIDIAKSLKNRTADDIGFYSNNLIKTGLIGIVASIVLCIIAGITGLELIGFAGIGRTMILSFTLTAGFGMIGLGSAAMFIADTNRDSSANIEDLPDISDMFGDDCTDEYEDNLDSILNELSEGCDSEDFNISFDDDDDTDDFSSIGNKQNNYTPIIPDTSMINKIDYNSKLESVPENRLLNRKILVDTFINMLPLHTPDFSFRREIYEGDPEFNPLEANCLSALSQIMKCEMEETGSALIEAYETYFSYELKLSRVRGLAKTNEIAVEMERYFRKNANDTSVNASVTIEGNFYKVVITKGVSAIITLGDTLKNNDVYNYFCDEKRKLPMITGIGELGDVVLADGKSYDSLMIAGKPRSGKSWYVLGLMMQMILFNTPEDVIFVVIDPKQSNLFKTMGLLPHIVGVHGDEHVIKILDDIIENEAPYRKQLLSDNKCDDIWALREKGVRVPLLYVVIDEYVTVKSNCEARGEDKDLDGRLQVLISQLPSLGIRLMFIPHRATGVVNKTNRTMLQFTAAVKSDTVDVCDTLGIKSWKHFLTNPGDIAIKNSDIPDGKYVRGIAISPSDSENTELIENAAKAFYKMGVDMPDLRNMEYAANVDAEEVRIKLGGTNRIQYSYNRIDRDDTTDYLNFTEKDL